MKTYAFLLTLLYLIPLHVFGANPKNVAPPENQLIFKFKEENKVIQIGKTSSAFQINLDELYKAKLRLAFNINSFQSEDKKVVKKIKSKRYFHANKYPVIQFVATKIYKANQHYKATGKLYVKNRIIPTTLPITIQVHEDNEVHKISGSIKIDCASLGIYCNDLSRKMKINFSILN